MRKIRYLDKLIDDARQGQSHGEDFAQIAVCAGPKRVIANAIRRGLNPFGLRASSSADSPRCRGG